MLFYLYVFLRKSQSTNRPKTVRIYVHQSSIISLLQGKIVLCYRGVHEKGFLGVQSIYIFTVYLSHCTKNQLSERFWRTQLYFNVASPEKKAGVFHSLSYSLVYFYSFSVEFLFKFLRCKHPLALNIMLKSG